MSANARIETDALDDLPGIEPARQRIAVEFVKEGDAHGEIGVGEQFDRLGFLGIGKQHRNIIFQRGLQQQIGELLRAFGSFADDNARRMEIVVQRLAFTQELGTENDPVAGVPRPRFGDISHRNGRFDDDHRVAVGRQNLFDDHVHSGGVEEIGVDVVIGRHRNNREFRPGNGLRGIGGEREIEIVAPQILLDQLILDRRAALG